jgi:hypothetical protein
MGLFGSKSKEPTPVPEIARADIASALGATSDEERSWLIDALPEINYLASTLPTDERVLEIAYCMGTSTTTVQKGLIAVTEARVVAVIGTRQRNQVVGQPQVLSFPYGQLANVTFAPKMYGGAYGYFDVVGNGRVTLEIGNPKKKDTWWQTFTDRALQEFNRSKF